MPFASSRGSRSLQISVNRETRSTSGRCSEAPAADGFPFPVRWAEAGERNPGYRRNRAAREARGSILAFVDDDASAEPGWLAAGAAAIGSAEIVGGPDPGPADAPYAERISNLLLGTRWIKWNFTKFLVDRNGNVVQRFEPAFTPDSAEVTSAIEKLLKQ